MKKNKQGASTVNNGGNSLEVTKYSSAAFGNTMGDFIPWKKTVFKE